jgi:hypothetical protein
MPTALASSLTNSCAVVYEYDDVMQAVLSVTVIRGLLIFER